jgi:hypothetical protein
LAFLGRCGVESGSSSSSEGTVPRFRAETRQCSVAVIHLNWNLLFASKNSGNLTPIFRLVAICEKISIRPADWIRDSHRHCPKYPMLHCTFGTPLLIPNRFRPIPMRLDRDLIIIPSPAAAMRSGPASLRIAVDSGDLPPGEANSSGHVPPAVLRSTPKEGSNPTARRNSATMLHCCRNHSSSTTWQRRSARSSTHLANAEGRITGRRRPAADRGAASRSGVKKAGKSSQWEKGPKGEE